MRLLVTGGAGFIGSAYVHRQGAHHDITVLDALTYAGNLDNLVEAPCAVRRGDIRDPGVVQQAVADVDAVVHFAAESHVDRSIDAPHDFVTTNVLGTFHILEACRAHDKQLVHVSTDEVYGDLGPNDHPFRPDDPYRPSSPYSASKAASDHFVRAYVRTYGLDARITNCSNNYGPRQFPEKLIPLMIQNAAHGKPLPIYGSGEQVRDWIWVDDHADGVHAALTHGKPGATYLFGGESERTNLAVVHAICDILDARIGGDHRRLIQHVTDRPGHDARYAIDTTAAREQLPWQPTVTFEEGLAATVDWYLSNDDWLQRVKDGRYQTDPAIQVA